MRKNDETRSLSILLVMLGLCGGLVGVFIGLSQANAPAARAALSTTGGSAQDMVRARSLESPKRMRFPAEEQVENAGSLGAEAAPGSQIRDPISDAVVEGPAAPVPSPRLTTAPSAPSRGRMAAVAMMLLGLTGIAFYYSRKRGGQRDGQPSRERLALRSTLRLGGRHQVSLVEVPGRLLVVGATEKGVNLLTEIPMDMDDAMMVGDAALDMPPAEDLEADIEPITRGFDATDPDPMRGEEPFLDGLMARLSDARPGAMSQVADLLGERVTPATEAGIPGSTSLRAIRRYRDDAVNQ